MAALKAYGPNCFICQQSDPRWLFVQPKSGIRRGAANYRTLKEEGYPDGYQVRCTFCPNPQRTSPRPSEGSPSA